MSAAVSKSDQLRANVAGGLVERIE